jgi:flagellar basal-body rod protein FlgG
MLRSLYISKTGMNSSQFRLDVVTNNLANVNTTGFKKSRAVFEDLMYQTIRQPGSQSANNSQIPTGLMVGTGSAPVATDRIHSDGNMQNTEGSLDVAINGKGFFRVTLPDGSTGYTRDGSFKLNSEGQLVTSNGYLLDPPITVPAGSNKLVISADGRVQVTAQGATEPTELGIIQISDFINPQGLESIGGNLYLETAASGAPITGDPNADGRGALKQGFLEASNVNVTEELINMIQAQRSFELNSRGVKTSDEMLQRLSQL